MIDSTYENISVSRGNDPSSLNDWFKWYIIRSSASSWSFLSEDTAITSPSDICMQEVMFSVLAPPRKTGIFDSQWKVIQSMKACWNFILLSDEAQYLSISTGNCCLVSEMLISIGSNLFLLLRSACLMLCSRYKAKTISMQLQPIDNNDLLSDKTKCSQFCMIVDTAHQTLLTLKNRRYKENWLSPFSHQQLSKSCLFA